MAEAKRRINMEKGMIGNTQSGRYFYKAIRQLKSGWWLFERFDTQLSYKDTCSIHESAFHLYNFHKE